jgi:uncharacterized protein involved in exopolysaccharide biosynthesis
MAGGLNIYLSPPSYGTSGKLYVEGGSLLSSLTATKAIEGDSWWATPAQTTVNEINELLATEAFVRSVVQNTSLESQMSGGPEAVYEAFKKVRESLWITARGDKLVEIGANTEEPVLAQQLVTSLMNSYVQWKLNADFQESVAAQNFFRGLIGPYQDQLQQARDELTDFLTNYPEPVRGERPPEEALELARLTQEVSKAEQRYDSAVENEESSRLAMAQSESVTRQTFLVIDRPTLPDKPQQSLRNIAIAFAIFFAIGLFLSLAGVAVNALVDRTLRFPVDVRNGLHLPLLAAVPTASPAPRQPVPTASGQAQKDIAGELGNAPAVKTAR